MSKRAHNFNPGPAALPLEVLRQAQEEFVDYKGIGMSIMEISHRSKEYEALNDETQKLLLELMNLPSGYQVLFMGGGASTQFATIPLNFQAPGRTAHYVVTGSFSEKAYQEAQTLGEASIIASTKEAGFSRLPSVADIKVPADSAYLHLTANNTIEGSMFAEFPNTGDVPLIGDWTSGILAKPVDYSPFAMVYAGAQKNLGPSGVTVTVIRDDLLARANKNIPTILSYATHAKNSSLYNTPPVHTIYMVNLMLKWVKANGGVAALEKVNTDKAQLVYDVIDRSGGYYKGMIDKANRSIMNITWRMGSEELEKKFVKESEQNGFVGLAGHRSVGGLRASAYNAVPRESCEALAQFMLEFQRKNG